MLIADGISTIIDDLYAGTLDESAWKRALIGTADLVRGAATFVFCINPSTNVILRDEVYRFDPVAVIEYRSHWFSEDIRVAASFTVPIGQASFEERLMPIKQWTDSAVYNDFLVPYDSPWFLAFALHSTPTKVVNFSINSTRIRGPFNEHDARRIQPLIPHIKRALEIKDRLEFAQVQRSTLNRSLDSLSFGVLVLDKAGHILEASAIARELLGNQSGLGLNSDGTVWLREPAGKQFNAWIHTGIPPVEPADGLLHARRENARPLSVTVTRLPDPVESWFGTGQPSWMLLLFDPDRELPTSTALIARDLGLSAREAEIATLLVSGYGVSVIARRLNISVHTARTHLKTIFAKTGSRSQTELILRIRSGPGGINAFR
jgi:DNA-binding CsgD family transcriptional regulator